MTMKAKLHILDIMIQNYKGYGDCITIPLDDLGPVLVVGDNGVGKTTAFADAIVWCLFGRTITRARPGDRIVNWERKQDTLVQLRTADGWVIKRTRKMAGHDDLLVYRDGQEQSPSTNENAQKLLDKLFNLDYDIFSSAILFGQGGKSFLKLGDQKRKAAIERILALDKLSVRSTVAGEMLKEKQDSLVTLNAKLTGLQSNIERLEHNIETNMSRSQNYESDRSEKIREKQESIFKSFLLIVSDTNYGTLYINRLLFRKGHNCPINNVVF